MPIVLLLLVMGALLGILLTRRWFWYLAAAIAAAVLIARHLNVIEPVLFCVAGLLVAAALAVGIVYATRTPAERRTSPGSAPDADAYTGLDFGRGPRERTTNHRRIVNEHAYLTDKAIRDLIVRNARAGVTHGRVPHIVWLLLPAVGGSDHGLLVAALSPGFAALTGDGGQMVAHVAVGDPTCETVDDAVAHVRDRLTGCGLANPQMRVEPLLSAADIATNVRRLERVHADIGLENVRPAGVQES